MAWRCSAATNAKLIENLFDSGIIVTDRVKRTMLNVDRKLFVRPEHTTTAYMDAPQPIGYSATISAPHMHAYALELLEPYLQPGQRVLDVGCGSGYLSACFADLVGPKGLVAALDHIPELVDMSRANMTRWRPESVMEDRGEVRCIVGDGRKGCPDLAPYDAIHVGAAAGAEVPETLLNQLNTPGRLVLPVEGKFGDQVLWVYEKDATGAVRKRRMMDVRYVALTDKENQLAGGRM